MCSFTQKGEIEINHYDTISHIVNGQKLKSLMPYSVSKAVGKEVRHPHQLLTEMHAIKPLYRESGYVPNKATNTIAPKFTLNTHPSQYKNTLRKVSHCSVICNGQILKT